jgi:hypothetical protein
METILNAVASVGFPAAVCVWLLYQKATFDRDIVESLAKITTILDERLGK